MWACLSCILGREVGDVMKSGCFYVAVIQVTLLFRLEMWVVTSYMARNLEGFHHWVIKRLTVKTPKRCQDGG